MVARQPYLIHHSGEMYRGVDGVFGRPRRSFGKPALRRGDGGFSVANGATAGFASVDALVALTILTSTIVLALTAGDTARRNAAASLEARQMANLLESLMAEPPQSGTRSGRAGELRWTVASMITPVEPFGLSLCRRTASVAGLRSERLRTVETQAICATDPKG